MTNGCSNRSIKPELAILFLFNFFYMIIVSQKQKTKPKHYTLDVLATLTIAIVALSRY